MEVEYRTYKPGLKLEEEQARIYTEASGVKATAEEILQRYKADKIDRNLVRFAFNKEGKTLAYCQARLEKKGSIAIGYPWAIPECPPEVQEKLFDNIFDYIIEKKNPKEIHYWIRHDWEHVINFFLRKGFTREREGSVFEFDVLEVSKFVEENSQFTSRVATLDDLDLLVEIARADKVLKTFMTKEAMTDYFTNKVLADGHAVLVFKDEKIVCASAPLRENTGQEENDHMFLRFVATRKGYETAWRKLIVGIAKECVSAGSEWTSIPLRVHVEVDSERANIIKTFNPIIKPSYDYYVLERETDNK